jgi:hypothetical protein
MKISLWKLVPVLAMLALPAVVVTQAGAQPNAPFAGGGKPMSSEEALKEAPKLDKSLVPLDKAFADAQAKLKKSPKDAKVKKTYVEAAYKYGHTVMTSQGKLPSRVMYRAALALFRKALAVNPEHKPSLDDKKLIEGIYQQMGMPIPK